MQVAVHSETTAKASFDIQCEADLSRRSRSADWERGQPDTAAQFMALGDARPKQSAPAAQSTFH